nr:reverse transcriptase domain-containing protein [Tanacetum cinerariifolium]
MHRTGTKRPKRKSLSVWKLKSRGRSCPKDCFPFSEIDWKVESLCGYHFKRFLDAYKGYHQIQMAKEDEEKMAFHTNQGVFCYTKMSFGLKNARAMYQRLVDKEFEKKSAETWKYSRALQALEINYNSMEKVVLALVHATGRLRRPRTLIRGQVLADFIAEKPDEGGPSMEVQTEETVPEPWVLFT